MSICLFCLQSIQPSSDYLIMLISSFVTKQQWWKMLRTNLLFTSCYLFPSVHGHSIKSFFAVQRDVKSGHHDKCSKCSVLNTNTLLQKWSNVKVIRWACKQCLHIQKGKRASKTVIVQFLSQQAVIVKLQCFALWNKLSSILVRDQVKVPKLLHRDK